MSITCEKFVLLIKKLSTSTLTKSTKCLCVVLAVATCWSGSVSAGFFTRLFRKGDGQTTSKLEQPQGAGHESTSEWRMERSQSALKKAKAWYKKSEKLAEAERSAALARQQREQLLVENSIKDIMLEQNFAKPGFIDKLSRDQKEEFFVALGNGDVSTGRSFWYNLTTSRLQFAQAYENANGDPKKIAEIYERADNEIEKLNGASSGDGVFASVKRRVGAFFEKYKNQMAEGSAERAAKNALPINPLSENASIAEVRDKWSELKEKTRGHNTLLKEDFKRHLAANGLAPLDPQKDPTLKGPTASAFPEQKEAMNDFRKALFDAIDNDTVLPNVNTGNKEADESLLRPLREAMNKTIEDSKNLAKNKAIAQAINRKLENLSDKTRNISLSKDEVIAIAAQINKNALARTGLGEANITSFRKVYENLLAQPSSDRVAELALNPDLRKYVQEALQMPSSEAMAERLKKFSVADTQELSIKLRGYNLYTPFMVAVGNGRDEVAKFLKNKFEFRLALLNEMAPFEANSLAVNQLMTQLQKLKNDKSAKEAMIARFTREERSRENLNSFLKKKPEEQKNIFLAKVKKLKPEVLQRLNEGKITLYEFFTNNQLFNK